MNAPRSKVVTVGGREFVVRPPLVETQVQIESVTGEGWEGVVERARLILSRTAPDLTVEWLAKNADVVELRDVMEALQVVLGVKGSSTGEAPAP
jgi:hypothetical protein